MCRDTQITLGFEQEYWVLNPKTLEPADLKKIFSKQRSKLAKKLSKNLNTQIRYDDFEFPRPEYQANVIEVGCKPCYSPLEIEKRCSFGFDIVRETLRIIYYENGFYKDLLPVGVGTYIGKGEPPLRKSDVWESVRKAFPTDENTKWNAATQIHVGVSNSKAELTNLQYKLLNTFTSLTPFLMLFTSSSPILGKKLTEYESCRTLLNINKEYPLSAYWGVPESYKYTFETYQEELERRKKALLERIKDPVAISYLKEKSWRLTTCIPVRINPLYNTLEIRFVDSQESPAAIAALAWFLITISETVKNNEEIPYGDLSRQTLREMIKETAYRGNSAIYNINGRKIKAFDYGRDILEFTRKNSDDKELRKRYEPVVYGRLNSSPSCYIRNNVRNYVLNSQENTIEDEGIKRIIEDLYERGEKNRPIGMS